MYRPTRQIRDPVSTFRRTGIGLVRKADEISFGKVNKSDKCNNVEKRIWWMLKRIRLLFLSWLQNNIVHHDQQSRAGSWKTLVCKHYGNSFRILLSTQNSDDFKLPKPLEPSEAVYVNDDFWRNLRLLLTPITYNREREGIIFISLEVNAIWKNKFLHHLKKW